MSPMANFTTTSPPPRPTPAQVMGVKVLEAAKADSVLRTATFAGGCFWGLELAFQRAAGVVSTKVRILGTSNFRAQERLKPQQAVRNQLQGELALTVKCVCVFFCLTAGFCVIASRTRRPGTPRAPRRSPPTARSAPGRPGTPKLFRLV